MLARLLAVGDDIDPGVFLLLQRQHRRVAFGFDERVAGELPWRPQHSWLCEPGGLRQAAGDRRLEQLTLLSWPTPGQQYRMRNTSTDWRGYA